MKKELNEQIDIRTLHSVEELAMVRNLEQQVWPDDNPVPVHHTITTVKNGGIMLGAFHDTQLIGFQYSFAGYNGTNAYLCSHTMGIHNDFRKMGIGEKLKRRQRKEALKKGYHLIVWTYDPLETVNGYLNLTKLGAGCKKYEENYYGELSDILNAGLPSDRFLVEWSTVETNSVRDRKIDSFEKNKDYPILIYVSFNFCNNPIPKDIVLNISASFNILLVPIPNKFQEIKSSNMKLALEWRMKTREVFTHYLNRGWSVTELSKSDHPNLHYYVLEKEK